MAIRAILNARKANKAADAMQFAKSFEGMPDFNPDNTPTEAFKARSVAKVRKEGFIKTQSKRNTPK